MVDAASVEGRDPVEDIKAINEELEKYNPELLTRPQVIAANKIEGLTLTALCDLSADIQAFCRTVFPDIPCYASVDELLHANCADAAIVAVPHPAHSDVALKVLEAGLHVLVEKPIDITLFKAQ